MSVKRLHGVTGVLSVTVLLSGCAVGPDFLHPAAPEVGRYTREPTVLRTVSADTKFGRSQHLVNGRDVPAEWWRLFHSPALNSLVHKSLDR